MSKKKRNKKHNSELRAKRFFSNVRIWSWESTARTEDMRIAHGEAKLGMFWRDLDQKTVNSIVARPSNWVICARAVCRLRDDVWIETEIRSAKNIRVNDMADEFEKMRKEVLKAQKLCHVVDVGWIIQTFDKKDRIDDLIETVHIGPVTTERQEDWKISNEAYEQRAQQSREEQAA